jgi:hypothetical protein
MYKHIIILLIQLFIEDEEYQKSIWLSLLPRVGLFSLVQDHLVTMQSTSTKIKALHEFVVF